MKNQTKLIGALAVLVSLSALIQARSTPLTASRAYEGCFTVITEKIPNAPCKTCYRRLTDYPGCKQPQLPDSNPCLLYGLLADKSGAKRSVCTSCKQGFAIDYDGPPSKCIQGQIQGCALEFVLRGQHHCQSCLSNQYVDILAGSRRCVSIEKPISNCKWGGVYLRGQSARCAFCADGYAVTEGGKCKKVGPGNGGMEGCALVDSAAKRCLVCDVFDGWGMQPDGSCAQMSS